jgi:hypothetical protein
MTTTTAETPAVTDQERAAKLKAQQTARAKLERARREVDRANADVAEVDGRERRLQLQRTTDEFTGAAQGDPLELVTAAADTLASLMVAVRERNARITGCAAARSNLGIAPHRPGLGGTAPAGDQEFGWSKSPGGTSVRIGGRVVRELEQRDLLAGVIAAACHQAGIGVNLVGRVVVDASGQFGVSSDVPDGFTADPAQWLADAW